MGTLVTSKNQGVAGIILAGAGLFIAYSLFTSYSADKAPRSKFAHSDFVFMPQPQHFTYGHDIKTTNVSNLGWGYNNPYSNYDFEH